MTTGHYDKRDDELDLQERAVASALDDEQEIDDEPEPKHWASWWHFYGRKTAEHSVDETHVAAEVHVHAAALYVSMLKNGYFDEAADFAEWYLEAFDHDLET